MTTMPNPDELIQFRGATVDRRTAAALTVMENRLGYELTVVQGHNPGGVDASAGTHDGLGTVDLAPFDWRNKVKVGREVGFDIWHRLPSEGPWAEHNHAVLHGKGHGLSPAAQRQTESYDRHRNGLANDAFDPFPVHPDRPPVFDYAAWWHDQQDKKHDDILRARVRTWRAERKRLAEKISAIRARRAMLKAKIAAAQDKIKKN
jgi:hypothetical protein